MISFDPSEDQKLMQQTAQQFAKTLLRPRMRELEKARAVPDEIRRQAHHLGLGLVALPEAVGGAGQGLTTAVILEEEIAWGDPAAAFGFGGPGALGMALMELATPEQAKAILAPFAGEGGHAHFGAVAWGEKKPPEGRDGLATTAIKDGANWKLDGDKLAQTLGPYRTNTSVTVTPSSSAVPRLRSPACLHRRLATFIRCGGRVGSTVLPCWPRVLVAEPPVRRRSRLRWPPPRRLLPIIRPPPRS
jgi:alkylation response protein AidB-like acyl-CoA dehydrogenase